MVFANVESPFFLGGGFDAVAAVYRIAYLALVGGQDAVM
jgi:hypothetical protein